MKRILLCSGLIGALAGSVSGQVTMAPAWTVNSGAGGYGATTGDLTRGLAYNPVTGNVLVATRTTPATEIRMFNGSTGAQGNTMNITGIAGGTFILSKIAAVDRGSGAYSVYVTNLTTDMKSVTSNFKIYKYSGTGSALENTLGAPTLVYSNTPQDGAVANTAVGPQLPFNSAGIAYRGGDCMSAVYSSVEGKTRILVPYRNATTQTVPTDKVLRFEITEATNAVTVSLLTMSGSPGNSFYGTVADGYDGPLYHFTVGGIDRFDNAGGNRTPLVNLIGTTSANPVLFEMGGRKFMPHLSSSTIGGALARYVALAEVQNSGVISGRKAVSSNAGANANNSYLGEFAFDSVDKRLFALVTNNFIAAYNLVDATSTGVPAKWIGAGSGDWHNAANWSHGRIPSLFDDVVLDNSTAVGSYTVTVSGANRADCQTVQIGYPANPNTITLNLTSSAAPGLQISSELSAADDFLIEQGGVFDNQSLAGAGNTVEQRNMTSTARVNNGGRFVQGNNRSFGTPFPAVAAATVNGALSFDTNGTMEFMAPGAGAISASGRTYGNLVFTRHPSFTASNFSYAGSGAFTVLNNLTVNADAGLAPSSYSGLLSVGGNIAADGVCQLGTTNLSPVQLTGAAIVSGDALALTSNATVTNSLNVQGTLNTGTNVLQIGTSSAALATLTGVGKIVGNVKKFIGTSAGAHTIPLGTATDSRSVTVDFPVAPTFGGSITASFTASNPGSAGLPLNDAGLELVNLSSNGFWTVTAADGLDVAGYNLQVVADGIADLTDISNVRIVKRADGVSNWTLNGTAGTNSGTTVARQDLVGFSDFGLASDSSQLPVSLSGFAID